MKYDLNTLRKIASTCKTRADFRINHSAANQAAKKLKLMNDIFKNHENNGYVHKKRKLPNGSLTKDVCMRISKKYTTRHEFQLGDQTAYAKCLKNNWLEEACAHMIVLGNRYKRHIYVIYNHNKAYVGLSYDPIKRFKDHSSRSYKRISSIIKDGGRLQILTEPVSVKDAIKLEEIYINMYKKIGFEVVNRGKPGALGASLKREFI